MFVLEGTRLAEEALAAGVEIDLVLRCPDPDARSASLASSFAQRGAEVLTITPRVMEACSGTETPPGLLVVAARPSPAPPKRLSLALVADGLADPGNLGTLMRTCLAAGAEALFLTPGTVDPFNPKVVRGAMGAHFHLPIGTLSDGPSSPQLDGLEIWLAASGGGTPYHRVDWRKPVAVVVGSEARGTDPSWLVRAAGTVHIPMRPSSESLNAAVAAAVVLFEIARQRGWL